jgi:hypothetical protein
MDRKIDLARHASVTVVLPWINHDSATELFEDQIVIFAFIEILLFEIAKPLDAG